MWFYNRQGEGTAEWWTKEAKQMARMALLRCQSQCNSSCKERS